ncbi:unnamed protein product [Fraxinus pennsylvanica]|uniref:Glycoside hydrolase family 3 C-terminal domain-containing protein n=1 Tax=Fraxinus pennsylvanica TaxID=56036 RepID=A0AAD2DR07_9LAMI|nr:unnamed protein product [Fraxinus pennsylvanica]
MVYIEERLGNKSDRSAESVVNSSTIATIVTSLSGPPAAVGIFRLGKPMAPAPTVRFLLRHSRPLSSRATVSSIFPKLSIPVHSTLSVRFSSFPKPTSPTTQVTHKEENEMVYIEERLGNKSDRSAESVVNSSTIAAIVTSLSGPPAAVGIVRLSGPSAVSILGRVFRSASKEKRRHDWRPTSHVVDSSLSWINRQETNGSDCDAVAIIHDNKGYAKLPEDGVADVLKAGMDVNCGSYLMKYTKSAVQKKKVLESDIDKALNNLFSMRIRLGLFNGGPKKQEFGKSPDHVCSQKHQDLALEAAKNGVVLLKNSANLVPFSKINATSLTEVPENKRRLSVYKGIVISKQNAGIHTTIRIRRIIAGVGVEIVFPV